MIGTSSSDSQLFAGRVVRIAGAGLIGLGAAAGLLGSVVLRLTTRRVVGCFIEYGPDPRISLVMFAIAAAVAALLACARTTTGALVGGLILGAVAILGPGDGYASMYGFLLAIGLVLVAVVAKCIEEFPGLRRPANSTSTPAA